MTGQTSERITPERDLTLKTYQVTYRFFLFRKAINKPINHTVNQLITQYKLLNSDLLLHSNCKYYNPYCTFVVYITL